MFAGRVSRERMVELISALVTDQVPLASALQHGRSDVFLLPRRIMLHSTEASVVSSLWWLPKLRIKNSPYRSLPSWNLLVPGVFMNFLTARHVYSRSAHEFDILIKSQTLCLITRASHCHSRISPRIWIWHLTMEHLRKMEKNGGALPRAPKQQLYYPLQHRHRWIPATVYHKTGSKKISTFLWRVHIVRRLETQARVARMQSATNPHSHHMPSVLTCVAPVNVGWHGAFMLANSSMSLLVHWSESSTVATF